MRMLWPYRRAPARAARVCAPIGNLLQTTRQLELEPSLTQIVVELPPLRLGRLTGLVFGPAIGFGIAELGRIALLLTRCGVSAFTTHIVSGYAAGCGAVVVGICVNGNGGWEPHAHVARVRGITKTQPRNREHAGRQTKDLCDGAHAIADDADRTTTKTDGLCGKDERLQS